MIKPKRILGAFACLLMFSACDSGEVEDGGDTSPGAGDGAASAAGGDGTTDASGGTGDSGATGGAGTGGGAAAGGAGTGDGGASSGGAVTGDGGASSGGAVTGEFQVDGVVIRAPGGEEFVPVGANVAGWNYYDWAHDTASQLQSFTEDWRFNTARANVSLFPTEWEGKPISSGNWSEDQDEMFASLDALIDAYTAKQVVVWIEAHDFTCKYPSASELDALDDFWSVVAERYKNNTYVWFNLMNEPQWDDGPASRRWVEVHQRLIATIRDDVGATNVLVVDGTHCGQEAKSWDDKPVSEANSAILSFGQELKEFDGNTYDNIVFSFHAYDQWGLGTQSFDNKLGDYLDRVHDKGHAIVCGEVGATAADSNSGGAATGSVYRKALIERGVGMLAWHWDPKDGFRLTDGDGAYRGSDVNSSTEPTNLSAWEGSYFWAATHEDGFGLK